MPQPLGRDLLDWKDVVVDARLVVEQLVDDEPLERLFDGHSVDTGRQLELAQRDVVHAGLVVQQAGDKVGAKDAAAPLDEVGARASELQHDADVVPTRYHKTYDVQRKRTCGRPCREFEIGPGSTVRKRARTRARVCV